jgi:LuxR family transcriptional regulator, maltose regulon positive regulatory protein
MSAKTPTVSAHWVYDPAQPAEAIRLDTPAWVAWLDAATTTRFAYPVFDPAHGYIAGFMTVRKEQRQRGGAYWVAYRRCQGRLRKVSLGRTDTLTQARLEMTAQAFRVVNAVPDAPGPAHARNTTTVC